MHAQTLKFLFSNTSIFVDVDLSAMLDDLSNFEHNLTSGAGQMASKKSSSQDSGIGFNGNSLPRNLTPSLDDMPQVGLNSYNMLNNT